MKTVMTLRTGLQLDARLVLGYCRHLFLLPQNFFDSMQTGEIISRMTDAMKIRVFINEGLAAIAVNILIILFSFGVMFTSYWKLALAMLVMMPMQILIYRSEEHTSELQSLMRI